MATEAPPSGTVAPPRQSDVWERRYARRLIVTDFLVVVWAVVGAQVVRFGSSSDVIMVLDPESIGANVTLSYTLLSVVLIVAWMLALVIFATRDSRVVGSGNAEYRRIFNAAFALFGLVAILAFLSRVDIARSYVLIAFPAGLLALWASRWIWRRWLVWQRAVGAFASKVVVVGSERAVERLVTELRRNTAAGYDVVGVVLVDASDVDISTLHGVPASADQSRAVEWMSTVGADTLVVASGSRISPFAVREYSWKLAPGTQHLVVAPNLTDVGGPRIHMRPVAGLPLVHVETPRYEGWRAFAKRTFDIVASGGLILLLSPVFIALLIAVKATSPGPILYASERIGHEGNPFRMLKFRSMRVNADKELMALLAAQGTEQKPLFKVKDDPRITPLGKFIRKYSLDELPQLINVFRGDMSLVGPRPQIAAEVALYHDAEARRLLLKPGISGLWQVSGRSNLSWEDAIRLDLYYVENWSLTGDIAILMKTFTAVVRSSGAV